MDWTVDPVKYKGLPDLVKDLHDHGQHYMIIVVSQCNFPLFYVHLIELSQGRLNFSTSNRMPIRGSVVMYTS